MNQTRERALHPQAHPNPAQAASLLDSLESALRAQLDGQQLLLKCLERKRQAIRSADIAEITAICGGENAIIQRMAELEKKRLEIVGALTEAFAGRAQQPLTLNEIAQRAAEPQQTRLSALAAQLRDAVAQLRRESSIVRTAAETHSRHLSGIVQTVHSALSRARVYGNRGTISLGSQVQSVVDIKS